MEMFRKQTPEGVRWKSEKEKKKLNKENYNHKKIYEEN